MSEETDAGNPGEEQTEQTETAEGESPERDELKRARDEANKFRKRAQAAEREAAKLKEATQSETEKLIAQARDEARNETMAAANARLLRSEAIAAASGKLANPRLAPQLLDLDGLEVDEDGNVDSSELTKRIDALLKSDPYLAPSEEPTRRGSGGVGARQQSSTTGSMESQVRAKLGI
jgi:hypothetical protein